MAEKIKVRVTPRDYFKGVRGKADSCPIALAVKRATGDTNVFVADGSITRVKSKHSLAHANITMVPTRVTEFVNTFDRRGPWAVLSRHPFGFTVEVN